MHQYVITYECTPNDFLLPAGTLKSNGSALCHGAIEVRFVRPISVEATDWDNDGESPASRQIIANNSVKCIAAVVVVVISIIFGFVVVSRL